MRRREALATTLPAAILLAVILMLSGLSPRFFSPGNIRLFLRTIVPFGLIAVGLYPVLVSKRLDLSQFAIADMAGTIAILLTRTSLSPLAAAILACAFGCAVGALNGVVVGYLRVNSFLATYCMSLVIKGIMFVLTKGRVITTSDRWLLSLGRGHLWGIPYPVFALVAGMLGIVYLMDYTIFGRKISALGSNYTACHFSGIRVRPTIVSIFLLSGLCSAIAGLATTAIHGSIATGLNLSVNLSAIIILVLGGTDLQRRGRPIGILLGLLIYTSLERMMIYFDVRDYYRMLIQGTVLLTGILLNASSGKTERAGP